MESPLKSDMTVLQKSNRFGGYLHSTIFIILLMVTVYCTPSFHCPEMVELGSSVNLTCYIEGRSNAHSYVTPSVTTAATCNLIDGKCYPSRNFNASVVNTSSSILTIHRTLKPHGGDWKCVNDPKKETCHVTVFKRPTCCITSDTNTSDTNTSSLNEGDAVTLTVNLSNSYCSESSLVELTTGVNTTLIKRTFTNISDDVLTKQFNVTSSHFGVVSLIYTCSSSSWNVSCEGIRQLVEGALTDIKTSTTQSTVPPTSDGPDTEVFPVWILITVAVIAVIAVILVIVVIVVIVVRWKKKRPAIIQTDQEGTSDVMLKDRDT
ncbi:uncharacterized protein LOC124111660 [Haliotis rufescens]|uniref:uncharacterized protein LOC124111660 n=1 Tax=Haliotis rufescens TaxID=6454 RepID=UPI00201EB725|nr:uncharacterized protein LOC124111660 [Haliotis rufescens]